MATATARAVANCINLCRTINQELRDAHHNHKECLSQHAAFSHVESFVSKIPVDGLTSEGEQAVDGLNATLVVARDLLVKVANTGPLVSLLTATLVRDEFLRINKDLHNILQALVAGVQMRDKSKLFVDLHSVQRELNHNNAAFFAAKEQISTRMVDIAVAAKQKCHPEEVLQQALLAQLDSCEEVANLSPEELLTEMQALQSEDTLTAQPHNHARVAHSKLSALTANKEFLVQQVCAALAPRAAHASQPLEQATAQIPDGYTCPISKELMLNPVMLAETGQSYEAANIQRWLETHDTCPVAGQQLSSRQMIPNYNLKKSINDWAEQHGITLPEAPSYVPLLHGTVDAVNPVSSTSTAGHSSATAVPAVPHTSAIAAPSTSRAQAAAPQPPPCVPTSASLFMSPQFEPEAPPPAFAPTMTPAYTSATVPMLASRVPPTFAPEYYPMLAQQPVAAPPSAVQRNNVPPAQTGAPQVQDDMSIFVDQQGYSRSPVAQNEARQSAVFCTTTRWTLAIVLVVVLGTVGVGVGVYMANKDSGKAPTDPQLEALLMIKEYLDTNGTALAEWDRQTGANGSYCNWKGVECTDGNITWLNLWPLEDGTGVKGLKGTLPPASAFEGLAGLTNITVGEQKGVSGTLPADWASLWLQDIKLPNNSIAGTIPPSWSKLSQLETLYLWGNKLSGQIPNSFSSLSLLSALSISMNQLTGTLPTWLGMLPRLKELIAWSNHLTGVVPDALGSAAMLEYLELSKNMLEGTIPESLGGLVRLQYLNLAVNKLQGTLPDSFKGLTHLQDLRLSDNQLSGTVPASWSIMTQLKEVYLWGNRDLRGCLPASWQAQLAKFNVQQNVLDGTSIMGFCSLLGNLTN